MDEFVYESISEMIILLLAPILDGGGFVINC